MDTAVSVINVNKTMLNARVYTVYNTYIQKEAELINACICDFECFEHTCVFLMRNEDGDKLDGEKSMFRIKF